MTAACYFSSGLKCPAVRSTDLVQVTVISLPVGSGQLQSTSRISRANSETCLSPINCLHGLRETCNTIQAFVSQEVHLNGLIGKHCEVTSVPKSTLRAQQTESVWIRSLLCVLHLLQLSVQIDTGPRQEQWLVNCDQGEKWSNPPASFAFSLRIAEKLRVVFGDQRWQIGRLLIHASDRFS